ncbi:MAG: DUF4433 domain-containing protein [Lentisphaerae bacterium]|nr:DUF4433 domain-containing protein [Lentisphaerota bacterium]
MSTPPSNPKIYHIVHVDRLPSILSDGHLFCDATMSGRTSTGTIIGMPKIKERRLNNPLASNLGLFVGDCVPFYFCPRSVMLYLIHRGNSTEISYRGGQAPIIHLEADLRKTVAWAEQNNLRWAFTLSNAGARYFEDLCDLANLSKVDWQAVRATDWWSCRDGKQAEFLVEARFPWHLIERIGVYSLERRVEVSNKLVSATHKPLVEVKTDWYY